MSDADPLESRATQFLRTIDPQEVEQQADKASNFAIALLGLAVLAAIPGIAILLGGSWWGVLMLVVSAALTWASGINLGGAGISRELAKRMKADR